MSTTHLPLHASAGTSSYKPAWCIAAAKNCFYSSTVAQCGKTKFSGVSCQAEPSTLTNGQTIKAKFVVFLYSLARWLFRMRNRTGQRMKEDNK
jgi:hypothetical protein